MNRNRLLLVLVLVLAVGLSGCANIFPFFKKQPTKIVVTPAEVEIAVGEERELTAVVKDKNGKDLSVKADDIEWVIEDVEEAEGAEEGGEDPGPVAELSAATGAKVKVKGLRVGEAKITVSYDDITAEVPVTVTEEPPVDPNLILYEDFSGLDSISEFWSKDYKALPGITDQPMYKQLGGNITLDNGELVLNGGRFSIGMLYDRPETKSSDTEAGGTFDLTRKYRITIEFSEVGGDTGKKFQIYVDNNTTSAGNSIHSVIGSTASRLYTESLSALPDSKVISVESTIGTNSSFIQLRVETNGIIKIKSILIEYVE